MATFEEYETAIEGVATVTRVPTNRVLIEREDEAEVLTFDEAMVAYGHAARFEADARDLFAAGEVPESEVFRCTEYKLRLGRALGC